MHFTYKYIQHEIEQLQKLLDFLFYKVWCKAKGNFDAEKLNGNPRLKEIYVDLAKIDIDQKGRKSAEFFNKHIENIYAEFLKLDKNQINKLKEGYKNNNNIDGLCTDKTIQPLLYKDIEADHEGLAMLLKSFYGNLYGKNSPFNLVIFGNLNKKLIPDHYSKFMTANNRGVCPFCGLLSLKANNHSKREAYDHYLPKAIFPFSSINFENLVPMCNDCNSSYKTTEIPIKKKNPLKNEDARKLAFFPYASESPQIEFVIQINTIDLNNLSPENIQIEITSEGYEEQIESWKRVFGLDERYKASLCCPDDGKVWVNSILEEHKNALAQGEEYTMEQFYDINYRMAKINPQTEKGFIKAPFLSACKKKGIFDVKTL